MAVVLAVFAIAGRAACWLLALLAGCAPGEDPEAPGATDDAVVETGVGEFDTAVEDIGDSPYASAGDPSLLCEVQLSCPDDIADEPKLGCDVAIEDGHGLELYAGMAGVELRGRSSLSFPKPQYGLELRSWQRAVLPYGSTWQYWDGAEEPASDWYAVDYDDSAWSSGAAPLGYGDDVETALEYGDDADDKRITAWFRARFEVTGEGETPEELQLAVVRDDGVAVYLDGVEVLRDNLAEGATADTLADEAVWGDDEALPVTVTLEPLEPGSHVLAVEVHQAASNSSDLRMDLLLEAIGDEEDVDLFGMGEESDWILNGAYIDRALFRNAYLYDLYADFEGVPIGTTFPSEGSRTAAESVYCNLTLDGEYRGIYVLTERVKRGQHRVDIASEEGTGRSFIIKLDDREERGGFYESAVSYGLWRAVYPKESSASTESLAGISARLEAWEEAHWSADPGDLETGVFAYVDLDSAVDWVLLQEFSKNNDAYFLSVHLWQDADGIMHFLPWDMDLTFGYPYTSCHAEDWIASRSTFVQTMAETEVFQDRLVSRWAQLRSTVMTEERLLARVDAHLEVLEPGLDDNVARWPVEDIAFSWGDVDNWLCPVASYEEEIERVREFIPARLEWMDANIADY